MQKDLLLFDNAPIGKGVWVGTLNRKLVYNIKKATIVIPGRGSPLENHNKSLSLCTQ